MASYPARERVTTLACCVSLCCIYMVCSQPQTVRIGCLLSDSSTEKNVQRGIQLAVDYINSRTDVLPNTTILPIYTTAGGLLSSFEYIKSTCYLVQNGVSIVIGPGISTGVKATQPISSGMHIPQLTPFATDPTLSLIGNEYQYLLKMSVPDSYQSAALVEIVKRYGWSRMAIINSLSDYGRNGLEHLKKEAFQNHWVISATVQFYPSTDISQINIRKELKGVRDKGVRVVILNCLAPFARVILDQANELDMLDEGWAWLLTDGITTMDGFYDQCAKVPKHLQGLIGTRPPFQRGPVASVFETLWHNGTMQANDTSCSGPNHPHSGYTLRAFDSVLVAAHGLHNFLQDGHNLTFTNESVEVCSARHYQTRPYGETLMKYISQVEIPGVMGYLNFTSERYPSVQEYEVVNLKENGWQKIGYWSPTRAESLQMYGNVSFPGETRMIPVDTSYYLHNVHFDVVMIEEAPFLMKRTAAELRQNSTVLYKGFCVDILDRLQQSLGFTYTIHLVADGQFGMNDPITKQWDGMVGELIRGEADMALASLAITFERQQAVDFTKPYLDLGLVVIMSKEKSHWNLLGFLQPFEWDLWIAVVASFLVSGIAVSVCSYFSPYGYRGRYIQTEGDSRQQFALYRHTFSFYNSLWFSFASWQKQGSALSPLCFSGRVVYGFWWFAITVITATYTANLAAFLTVRRLDTGINTIHDLANQRAIKYGTVRNTATERYFEMQIVDPYKRAYAFMMAEDTWVANASEGIQRVRNSYDKPKEGQYAFIYDSTLVEYAVSQPPCTTQSIGRIFNNFGYGIAFPKDSPYTDIFSLHILQLRQSPYMEERRTVWFTGPCKSSKSENEEPESGGEKASLETMAGVFYFMLLGLGLGLIMIPVELCVAAWKDVHFRKVRKDEHITWLGALKRRLVKIFQSAGDCFQGCFSGTIADPGLPEGTTNDSVLGLPERFTRLESSSGMNSHETPPLANGVTNYGFSSDSVTANSNDPEVNQDAYEDVFSLSVFSRTMSQYNERTRNKNDDNVSSASI